MPILILGPSAEKKSSNGILVMGIAGGVSAELLVSVIVAAIYVCCCSRNDGMIPKREEGAMPSQYASPPLAINTGMPTSRTGYLGPYPQYVPGK